MIPNLQTVDHIHPVQDFVFLLFSSIDQTNLYLRREGWMDKCILEHVKWVMENLKTAALE